ncbi:Uncharacterised protein [Mycobacteroides abscessus subsp. massiliense]|nr:hypothetical protein [Mycobacteroides abscessus]SHW55140.1 Uncharacterised protein [Mycobacteroides abscessus subsp. abscessus]SKE15803.1 Uncharacterised protein [Mycobacteroides abscessus subsp. massiliense]SHX63651.1 Uncharacterised protein [Mycobacteroides abscessus subsp. abscessus]SIC39639.1 Uncharacterised protein [Mycobacteroides abscessus subsp. abscessus]
MVPRLGAFRVLLVSHHLEHRPHVFRSGLFGYTGPLNSAPGLIWWQVPHWRLAVVWNGSLFTGRLYQPRARLNCSAIDR